MNADARWAPGERGRLIALGVAVLGAMLYPLRQTLRPLDEQVDSFPLSYYPMFRTLRGPTARVTYAVGVDAAGQRHHLPHTLLGGGGFNQVRRQLNRAVKTKAVPLYAEALATRIAADPAHRHLVRAEIIRGSFDLDSCLLAGEVRATKEKVLASVPVGSPAPAPAPMTQIGTLPE